MLPESLPYKYILHKIFTKTAGIHQTDLNNGNNLNQLLCQSDIGARGKYTEITAFNLEMNFALPWTYDVSVSHSCDMSINSYNEHLGDCILTDLQLSNNV